MCVSKEKLDCLKEILQGTYNIVWPQLCGIGQMINEFHENRHHCSTRIQWHPLLMTGQSGTEVRLFVHSVCPYKY